MIQSNGCVGFKSLISLVGARGCSFSYIFSTIQIFKKNQTFQKILKNTRSALFKNENQQVAQQPAE